MNLDLDFRLTELFSIVPNESADEPYMWVFFLKLDGDTVRQVVPNALGLQGTVQVTTAGGSQGNLGATGVKSQRSIPVPTHIGSHLTRLRPISITFASQRFFVPGQFVAVAVVLEEDNSPSDGIENGHQSLRLLIEQRVNDFVSAQDLAEIFSLGNERVQEFGGALQDHIGNIVNERFDALIQEIRDNAKSVITLELLDAHTLGAIWEFLDADDLINAVTFRFNERSILNDENGMNRSLLEFIIAADEEEGEIDAMYRVVGQMNAMVQSSRSDVRQTSEALDSTVADTGQHTFTERAICISPGQQAEWTRFDQRERETFDFLYPFLPVTWSIEGQAMNAPSGEIRLTKTCTFPFFDPNKPSRPGYRAETKEIAILYETFRDGMLPGIRLRNRPEDGNYFFNLQVGVVVGGTTNRVIANFDLAFDGQALTSPFYKEYDNCLDRIFGYKQFRRVGPRELWGPFDRKRWLDEQVRIGEEFVQSGLMKPSVFDAAVRVMQQKLRRG
jgi:hypothetical protein